MANFTLEITGIKDVDTLLRHRMSMWMEIYPSMYDSEGFLFTATKKWIIEKLNSGTMVGIIARTPEGKIAGSGCILIREDQPRPGSLSAEEPYILSMYTEKECRGQGVATSITKFCIDWAKERGYERISLHASIAGKPVYKKAGFRQTNEMRLML